MGLQMEAGVVTPALIEGLNKGEASGSLQLVYRLWVELVLRSVPPAAPGPRQT
jgi:hypothetical protein